MNTSGEISLLLQSIEEAYHRKAWHGPNLRGSLRGLTATEVSQRPAPGRHNIWEIALHCAYWKYTVRRRILREKRGSFPVKGSNWFARPLGSADERQWKEDLRLLDDTHRLLIEVIRDLRSSDLERMPSGSRVSNRMILAGIAAHDVYHAGQIQLIKRLIR